MKKILVATIITLALTNNATGQTVWKATTKVQQCKFCGEYCCTITDNEGQLSKDQKSAVLIYKIALISNAKKVGNCNGKCIRNNHFFVYKQTETITAPFKSDDGNVILDISKAKEKVFKSDE